MNEEIEKTGGSRKKLITGIVIISIVFCVIIINASIQNYQDHAQPSIYLEVVNNGTISNHRISAIDYKYSLDHFAIEKITISVYSYILHDNGTLNYGDYHFKGPLSEILNNESSPLVFYDNDNDSMLGINDVFESDMSKISEENLSSIGFSLRIIDGENEIKFQMIYG